MKEVENKCPGIPNCPINGEWSSWSKSEDCDKLCGEGTEIFLRYKREKNRFAVDKVMP